MGFAGDGVDDGGAVAARSVVRRYANRSYTMRRGGPLQDVVRSANGLARCREAVALVRSATNPSSESPSGSAGLPHHRGSRHHAQGVESDFGAIAVGVGHRTEAAARGSR